LAEVNQGLPALASVQVSERLYLLALSRRPSAEERTAVTEFVGHQHAQLTAERRSVSNLALPIPAAEGDPHAGAALVDACLAILNSNEFIYID
jgi:hypothetical protein